MSAYQLPTVWQDEASDQGAFTGLNRPTAGAAPFLGGGFGHFFNYAPEKLEYPINRFTMEVKRQLDLLDRELAQKPYIAGNDYTIADIAIWSWYGQLVQGNLYQGSAKFLDASSYQNLVKWAAKIANRPTVKRGLEVTYKEIKQQKSHLRMAFCYS